MLSDKYIEVLFIEVVNPKMVVFSRRILVENVPDSYSG